MACFLCDMFYQKVFLSQLTDLQYTDGSTPKHYAVPFLLDNYQNDGTFENRREYITKSCAKESQKNKLSLPPNTELQN